MTTKSAMQSRRLLSARPRVSAFSKSRYDMRRRRAIRKCLKVSSEQNSNYRYVFCYVFGLLCSDN